LAIDDLNEKSETLWRQLQALTDRAFDYITISRQLIFLDVLIAEMKRRTGEEDAEAFGLAIEDICGNAALAPESGCRRFAQEMDPRLEKLPVGRWIRHMLEPPTAFENVGVDRAILSFEFQETQDRRGTPGMLSSGAPGLFSTPSSIFSAGQTIDVTPIRYVLPDAVRNDPGTQS
jgi:hypothetical protein